MKSFIYIIGRPKIISCIADTLQGLPHTLVQIKPAEFRSMPALKNVKLIIIDRDWGLSASDKLRFVTKLKKSRIHFIFVTSSKTLSSVLNARRLGGSDIIFDDFNRRELIMRVNAVLGNKARLTCFEGEAGLFSLLIAVKPIPNSMITSIVNMADDGGSSHSSNPNPPPRSRLSARSFYLTSSSSASATSTLA